jgi:hypothetical protein
MGNGRRGSIAKKNTIAETTASKPADTAAAVAARTTGTGSDAIT